MPAWLVKVLPIVIPIVVLSVLGVVVGGIVKTVFNIPDEVATKAGFYIAVGSLLIPVSMFVIRKIRNRSR